MWGTALCPHSAQPCPPGQGHRCVGDMGLDVQELGWFSLSLLGSPPKTLKPALVLIQGGQTPPKPHRYQPEEFQTP